MPCCALRHSSARPLPLIRQPGVLQHLRGGGPLAGVEVEHGQQEVAQGQCLHVRGGEGRTHGKPAEA